MGRLLLGQEAADEVQESGTHRPGQVQPCIRDKGIVAPDFEVGLVVCKNRSGLELEPQLILG